MKYFNIIACVLAVSSTACAVDTTPAEEANVAQQQQRLDTAVLCGATVEGTMDLEERAISLEITPPIGDSAIVTVRAEFSGHEVAGFFASEQYDGHAYGSLHGEGDAAWLTLELLYPQVNLGLTAAITPSAAGDSRALLHGTVACSPPPSSDGTQDGAQDGPANGGDASGGGIDQSGSPDGSEATGQIDLGAIGGGDNPVPPGPADADNPDQG